MADAPPPATPSVITLPFTGTRILATVRPPTRSMAMSDAREAQEEDHDDGDGDESDGNSSGDDGSDDEVTAG